MRPLLFLITIVISDVSLSNTVYDEAIDGDLPGIFDSLFWDDVPVLHFSDGVNVIWGSAPLDPDVETGDTFRFAVPLGNKARVTVSETTFGLQPGEAMTWAWELREKRPDSSICNGSRIAWNFSGVYQSITELPRKFSDIVLGAGEYCIFFNFVFPDVGDFGNFDPTPVYMDYKFEISVSDNIDSYSVPIPYYVESLLALFVAYFLWNNLRDKSLQFAERKAR